MSVFSNGCDEMSNWPMLRLTNRRCRSYDGEAAMIAECAGQVRLYGLGYKSNDGASDRQRGSKNLRSAIDAARYELNITDATEVEKFHAFKTDLSFDP
jgi:hypothetical protein